MASIGRKAMAAALSDLAAMGAEPGEAYVQLGVPADLDTAGAEELAEGLGRCAAENGISVLGGDVSRAPVLWIGVTVVGHADEASDFVTRGGAQDGDVLVVTGELGGARAGLALLEQPDLAERLQPDVADALRRRQLEPVARLDVGRALRRAGAHAMIDVSDGLAGDARHIARAGAVRVAVELERLPLAAGVAEVAAAQGEDAAGFAAAAGEDYELLAAVAADRVNAARAAVEAEGVNLTAIGRVEPGSGLALIDRRGRECGIEGFDQLGASGSRGEPV
jgi:thiamine-monophosphate kinase